MVTRNWKTRVERLLKARQQAIEELNHLRQELTTEVDIDVDEADEQITERETAAILITMLENRVEDIESALIAIEDGRYGFCERCGEAIEQERLQAMPDTRLCITCQRLQEEEIAAARAAMARVAVAPVKMV
jgi:DnaK suppressor protein